MTHRQDTDRRDHLRSCYSEHHHQHRIHREHPRDQEQYAFRIPSLQWKETCQCFKLQPEYRSFLRNPSSQERFHTADHQYDDRSPECLFRKQYIYRNSCSTNPCLHSNRQTRLCMSEHTDESAGKPCECSEYRSRSTALYIHFPYVYELRTDRKQRTESRYLPIFLWCRGSLDSGYHQ